MLEITSDLKAAPGNSIIYEKKSGKKKKKPSPWEVQIQLWKIHKGDLGESISGNLTAPAQRDEQRGGFFCGQALRVPCSAVSTF